VKKLGALAASVAAIISMGAFGVDLWQRYQILKQVRGYYALVKKGAVFSSSKWGEVKAWYRDDKGKLEQKKLKRKEKLVAQGLKKEKLIAKKLEKAKKLTKGSEKEGKQIEKESRKVERVTGKISCKNERIGAKSKKEQKPADNKLAGGESRYEGISKGGKVYREGETSGEGEF